MSFIVKNTTIFSPLDLLAPHTCRCCGVTGEPLCNRCKKYLLSQKYVIPPKCKAKNLPPLYTIGKKTGLLERLIHDFKYDSVRDLGVTFAKLLNQILPIIPGEVVIVPLPTIPRHIRERGQDHTKRIAKNLAKLRGYKTKQILERKTNTVQVGADRPTRIKQAKNAYTINPKTAINPSATYILFDDVWTTGASMKAALKELQRAGALKIILVTLAVS